MYKGKSKVIGNFNEYKFYATTDYGTELVSISQNDELFSIIYKLADSNFFSPLKEKLLTTEFGYVYSYKNTKYYESANMRIGVNTERKILSFFVALN